MTTELWMRIGAIVALVVWVGSTGMNYSYFLEQNRGLGAARRWLLAFVASALVGFAQTFVICGVLGIFCALAFLAFA